MIYHGDLFDVLPTLKAESIDACVTDPPYGLGFMAKDWDVPGGVGAFPMRRRVETDAVNTGASRQGGRQRSCVDFQKRQNRDAQAMQAEAEQWAREVFRVLKPGAHLVGFGGTRTFHRLICAIEDAGFEIRDCLSWLYGQGFPKSLNLGDGRGTALKPSWEPIVLARKPLMGTVAANVLRYGTGALNIDACRIEGDSGTARRRIYGFADNPETAAESEARGALRDRSDPAKKAAPNPSDSLGRWPANVVLDEEAAAMLDEMTGEMIDGVAVKSNTPKGKVTGRIFQFGNTGQDVTYGGSGGASRFYYVAKPSREERDFGCERMAEKLTMRYGEKGQGPLSQQTPCKPVLQKNIHPTVKPVALMRWLVKLVTPPGGTVLDPFMGSGTTGMACRYEQRQFIGIEREAEYVAIAERRIAAVAPLFANQDELPHAKDDAHPLGDDGGD